LSTAFGFGLTTWFSHDYSRLGRVSIHLPKMNIWSTGVRIFMDQMPLLSRS